MKSVRLILFLIVALGTLYWFRDKIPMGTDTSGRKRTLEDWLCDTLGLKRKDGTCVKSPQLPASPSVPITQQYFGGRCNRNGCI